jgi:monoamine oxidase
MARSKLFRALGRALTEARAANLHAAGEPPPITRRDFLRATAATGVAALAAGCAPHLSSDPRIVIVGAGLAGLNAAWRLQKAGFASRIFEARERVGGRVATANVEGLAVNMGGEFINSDHEDLIGLAKELGVELLDRREETTDVTLPTVAYFFGGRALQESELSETLRPFAVAIASDADRLDREKDPVEEELDRLSVADYLDRHAALLTRDYLRPLIEAAIRAEFGVEPADASALQLVALLPTVDGQRVEVLGASDEAFSIHGGSAKLAEALAARLASRVEFGRRLERIEQAGTGYRLVFSPSALVEADFVIVALPAPPLRRVTLEIDMPPKLRRFIDEVGPGSSEKHVAAFRRRVWREANAFSREAWTDLGFAEVWDSAAAEPDRPASALTFFVGGREVAGADAARFTAALERLVPGLSAASAARNLRTDWSNDQLTGGAYTNLKPGQMTALGDQFWSAEHEVRAGRVYFAGEHLSEEHYGYMNGAAETGRLAAAAIVKRLTGA